MTDSSAIRRARAARLLGIWLAAGVAEWLAWRYFVSRSFYRDLMLPATAVVAIAAIAASWRVTVGRRMADRRTAERRAVRRRADRR